MTVYEPLFFDIETTGGNPLAQEWHTGEELDARVTAIGIATLDNWRSGSKSKDIKVVMSEQEYSLLKEAKSLIEKIKSDKESKFKGEEEVEMFMTSWNGYKFDHPYLGARYARYRQVQDCFNSDMKRLDMLRPASEKEYGTYKYKTISQDDFAEKYCSVEVKDETDGSDMPQFFIEESWGDIEYHCREDMRVMCDIFVEHKEMFMNHFYDHYRIDRDPEYPQEVEY